MIMYYEYCHIFGHKGIFQILLIFFFLPITILLNRRDIYKFWFFGKNGVSSAFICGNWGTKSTFDFTVLTGLSWY